MIASFPTLLHGQHVILAIIDGARYSETLGAESTYIPFIWDTLRPQGTIYTNFWNEGVTKTCPGHAAMLTGTWQNIANDGTERPTAPTLFEYWNKQHHPDNDQSCVIVSGKAKLEALTFSTSQEYGKGFRASFISTPHTSDIEVWERLRHVMKTDHPKLVMANFPEVDVSAHGSSWKKYLSAITQVDSLIALLWREIQSDEIYHDSTTLIVTSDHGRHDDQHGGMQGHGDSCQGCRHIMMLVLGPQFQPGAVVSTKALQIDLEPTIAELLGMNVPPTRGKSLLPRPNSSRNSR